MQLLINRLFFNFVITIARNEIDDEGGKALAKALKFNKNLTSIDLGKFMQRLFKHIITVI